MPAVPQGIQYCTGDRISFADLKVSSNRRLESTKNTIDAICSHSRRRLPTYSESSRVLSRFLRAHGHELGLGAVIRGLHLWVSAHINSEVCFDFSLPGELFSERKTEFTESFCLVLCHFGDLIAVSARDFNECSFVWRFHPHLSDKYAMRVSRKISRLGLDRSGRAVHSAGTLIQSTARRENVRGQNDNLYHFTVNALLCPIL